MGAKDLQCPQLWEVGEGLVVRGGEEGTEKGESSLLWTERGVRRGKGQCCIKLLTCEM